MKQLVLYRAARTFGRGGSGFAAWRRMLETRIAVARIRHWLRRGDEVLAVGDDPAGLPAGTGYLPLTACHAPDSFTDLTAAAADLACGWYKRTGAEERCARLRLDGMALPDALEHERVRYAETLLQRVRVRDHLRQQHPGSRLYADGAHADISDGTTTLPLLPARLQALLDGLEAWHRRRSIRTEFERVPATGNRPRPGTRSIILPLHGLNLGGLRYQAPVVRLLAETGCYDLVLIAPLPEVAPEITRLLGDRVRVMAWQDYWQPRCARVAQARWRRWQALLAEPDIADARRAHYAACGVAEAMLRHDRFTCGPLALAALRYAALYEEVVARERPAALLLSLDNNWRERLLVDVARRAGVPTVVQHNVQPTVYPVTASLHAIEPPRERRPPRLRLHLPCDRTTVMGEAMRAMLVAAGCATESIRVTGIARYDGWEAQRARLRARATEMRHALGVPDGSRLVLLTTQPPSQIDGSTRADRDRVARAVAAAAAALSPPVFLLIKPHHEELAHPYREVLATAGAAGTVADCAASLLDLLAAADLLVTCFSTSAFEAMALDVPVLTVNFSGRPDPIPYVASGAATGAYHPDELPQALAQALVPSPQRQEAARAFLRYNIDLRDGAAQRGAAAVREVADR